MAAVTTQIPARLDRLPWTRFHLLVILALGITWILDGLEVTIVGAMGGILQHQDTLALTSAEIGDIGAIYIAGAVIGALIFGYLTDRNGRKVMFFTTLSIYLAGVLVSTFAQGFWTLALGRVLIGLGIGGEYAAVNSAIDELIPARLRGRIALLVNGSFWIGAALGSGLTTILLDPAIVHIDVGWRIGFALGAIIGVVILFLRSYIPESPRWQATHGYMDEAEATMKKIEATVSAEAQERLAPVKDTLTIHPQQSFGFGLILRAMFSTHRQQSILCLVLMGTQAFLYNALFFTYALILVHFFNVDGAHAGLYLLPFAAGNFLGPVILGPLFDTVGRRTMIAGTYALSGILLAITAWMFVSGMLTATTQTICWSVIFFFASAAASSAYLTVSEIFPLEVRALAISLFYALGTAVGGILGPFIFGRLVDTGSIWALFGGFIAASILMIVAAITELAIGIDAEGKALEEIATPLAAHG